MGQPTYGGTITLGNQIPDTAGWDLADPRSAPGWYIFDSLFTYDSTVDPSVEPYKGEFVAVSSFKGTIAESWEQTDPVTITVHLKNNVRWQNIPPVNGRQLVANDVKYTYDYVLGTGSGFTQGAPFYMGMINIMDRIDAPDDYTLVFHFKNTGFHNVYWILRSPAWGESFGVMAPEVIKAGNLKENSAAVGSGPWMLKEFVPQTSLTFTKNPTYWLDDERHPGNKIPYVDEYRDINIPDMATTLAALRTQKIDFVGNRRGGPSLSQIQAVLKTDPEMQSTTWSVDGFSLDLRCDNKPFTDLNVRKALQMAINLPLIAQTHFAGKVEGVSCGLINPIDKDWTTPFSQWPANLQDEYTYNPAKAKEILASAGYPNGFTTNCVAAVGDDPELLQIIKAQLAEINVTMDINQMDMPTMMAYCMAGKNDQMTFMLTTGMTWGPIGDLEFRTVDPRNYTHNNDATFTAMVEKMKAATNEAEAQKLTKEADLYALSQHWAVNILPGAAYILWQPYLKGYNGEFIGDGSLYWARAWIDKDMK